MQRDNNWLWPLLLSLIAAPLAAQTLVVGVEDLDYLPYYSSEQGRFLPSPARQILDRFAAQHQYELEYTPLPVARLTQMFIDGDVDFKFPDNPDWALQAKQGLQIHYSLPMFHFTDGIMVLPERLGLGLNQLRTLGTVRGFSPPQLPTPNSQTALQLQETPSLEGVVFQALYQRVYGAYFNIAVAAQFLDDRIQQPGSLIFDPDLPHTDSHYALSSLHHPEVIAQFNQFLLQEADWILSLQPLHPNTTFE